jgi:hypothetical protein
VEAEVSTNHADALGRLVEIPPPAASFALPVCGGERQNLRELDERSSKSAR